eukprot:gene5488-5722_t
MAAASAAVSWAGRSKCPRSSALICFARRTQSGGRDTGSSKRTSHSTSTTGSRTAAKRDARTTIPSKTSSPPGTSSSKRSNVKQQPSRLETFFRTTPGFNRFIDGTLMFGDAVMVLATEVSSERLPFEQVPALASVAVGSWILAAAVLGDYAMEPDPDENPLSNALGVPILQAVVSAMITWAASMVVAILGFSWLVSHYLVEPELVLELTRDGMLSPQLEISVALLITMSCWRGMAARLRL